MEQKSRLVQVHACVNANIYMRAVRQTGKPIITSLIISASNHLFSNLSLFDLCGMKITHRDGRHHRNFSVTHLYDAA